MANAIGKGLTTTPIRQVGEAGYNVDSAEAKVGVDA